MKPGRVEIFDIDDTFCAALQQAAIGRLGAAVEIDCEFLAAHGWQIEGERRIIGHGGCDDALIAQGKEIGHRFAM